MRITQNNIVQNSVNLQKNLDLQSLVGKTLTGKVVGTPDNGMVGFAFNGNKVILNVGQLNLVDQQALTIMINDTQDGVLLASVLKEDAQMSTAADGQLLSKLGMPVNTENLQIINQLKLSNLPINSESFQNMRQGMIEVKTLLNELSSGGQINLSKDLETPLKQLVLNLISSQTEGANSSNKLGDVNTINQLNNSQGNHLGNNLGNHIALQNNELIQSSTASNVTGTNAQNVQSAETVLTEGAKLVQTQGAGNPMDVFNPNGSSSSLERSVESSLMQSSVMQLEESVMGLDKGQIQAGSNLISETDNVKVFELLQNKLGNEAENVKALLEQFGVKEDALIVKNELTLNLKNVAVSQLIANQPEAVKEMINKLVSDINRHRVTDEKISEIVEILKSEAPDEEKLIQIAKHLESESKMVSETKAEINIIKELSNFSKPLYDQVVYMPIQVPVGKENQQVELYYRKKKKNQENADQFQVLIALNTKHFDEVRCLIDKNKNNIDLNFTFAEDSSLKTFEGLKNELETALERFEQFNFKLSFRVRTDSHPIQELMSDTSTQFGFDMKV